MTDISYWLAEATADRLERIADRGCAYADEVEDVAIALEAYGIEPIDYEHRDEHPLVQLVDALCELEQAADITYLSTAQQASLNEAAYRLRS